MQSNRNFLYQPSLMLSTIDWCWTFIILLTGIIFWLEVTHFQLITLFFLTLFFVIAGLEVGCRQLQVTGSHLVVLNLFHHRWRSFNLKDSLTQMTFTAHSILIRTPRYNCQYLLRHRDVQILEKLIAQSRDV